MPVSLLATRISVVSVGLLAVGHPAGSPLPIPTRAGVVFMLSQGRMISRSHEEEVCILRFVFVGSVAVIEFGFGANSASTYFTVLHVY